MTRVLFIGGLGRSGSTLLELMLGRTPGVAAIGEVRHLWERGLANNDRCACGRPFLQCPFWREVGERAFGGWEGVDAPAAVAAARAVDRHRHLPALLAPGRRPGPALARYGTMLEKLFAAVASVSGAEVVVDASKDPPHGFVLRSVPALDVRAVHLVRDSRAVAFSWSKVVARPDAASGEPMTRMPASRAGLMWVDANLVTEALARLGVPSVRIRYEDLAAAPLGQLRRVGALAGVEVPATAVADGDPTPAHHAIGGNPVRFRPDPLTIRADDEWRTRMPASDRRVVTALTAALLHRYGYPVRSPRRQLGPSGSQRTSRSSNG